MFVFCLIFFVACFVCVCVFFFLCVLHARWWSVQEGRFFVPFPDRVSYACTINMPFM